MKSENKNDNFQTQYCLGSGSVGFSATESSEVSLNGNVYDFSVDYKHWQNLHTKHLEEFYGYE